MDGRSLLGALVRFFGFIAAALPALLISQTVLQLAALAIAISSSKQPGAGDVITQSLQQAALPLLTDLVLFAIGLLLLRNGDKVASWAYSAPRSRRAPTEADATAKSAAKKPAPKPKDA